LPLLITIDTEPDWGLSGLRALTEILPRFLDVLEETGACATFFVVANAVDDPGAACTLARIPPRHEIASHGLTHRPLDGMPPEEVRTELTESRRRLEDFFQRPVRGVRAPFFRTPVNGWLDAVRDAGYEYESSMGSIWPSRVNTPPRRWRPVYEHGVWRLPISTFRDRLTPFCLTYLRVAPAWFLPLVPHNAPMFYLHLHEFLSPETAAALPAPLRWLLRRNAGPRAWALFRRVLERVESPGDLTCAQAVEAARGAAG